MQELNKQDIIDLLYGCAVLGTGGGGSLQEGLAMMEEDFKAGRKLKLVPLSELPEEGCIASPYGCGAPSASSAEAAAFADIPKYPGSPAILAFRGLEDFLRQKICAVSSTELGGLNTAEALHIACMLDLPLADGDPAGRSVPELIHSTFYLKGKSIAPMAVATQFADVIILKDVVDDFRAEALVRSMACVSGNEVSVCDHPMTGKEYRDTVIPGAISYALEIGRLLRTSKENIALKESSASKEHIALKEHAPGGAAVAETIAGKMNGKFLFSGKVAKLVWECRDGFDYGTILLSGTGAYEGERYRIEFKNENIAAYRNEKIEVTVPDLICMLDAEGNPMTNPDFSEGDAMHVFALPAPEIWTTEEGLAIFGPRYFGFDTDYIPIGERFKK